MNEMSADNNSNFENLEALVPNDCKDCHLPKPSNFELVCLTSFSFPYGLICSVLGLFLLPIESRRMFPSNPSVALGCSLGLTGLSQLICPFAGMVSDKQDAATPSLKRQPYILFGTLAGCLGLHSMGLFSVTKQGIPYYFTLFLTLAALNMIYSVQGGLVPDITPPSCHGKASGIVAVGTVFGSSGGMLVVILGTGTPPYILYLVFGGLVVASCSLVLLTASRIEQRIPNIPRAHQGFLEWVKRNLFFTPPSLSIGDVSKSFLIDTSTSYDFYWVFWGRTMYYFGASCQAFLLYYMRDCLRMGSEIQQKKTLGALALCAQLTAATLAYPFGRLSEAPWIGKKRLIYLACLLMTCVYTGFVLANWSGVYALEVLLISSLLFGVGNGCFLSVDYALALETLPSSNDVTQSLGLWGVSGFIGSSVGPLLWGSIIEVFGSTSTPGVYDLRGYVTMLAGGAIATLAGGFLVHNVKNAN